MTGRERITAAARGGEVDVLPTLSAFVAKSADGTAVQVCQIGSTMQQFPDCAVMATVLSPLGRALERKIDIVRLLHENVDSGTAQLSALIEETRTEMSSALDKGADGVFYVLDGAYPSVTTPMEYGGHFLEIDRQLLGEIEQARLNVLYVCGQRDPYVDFVSDLPAHVFAWDARSGVTADYVRSIRQGAIAADIDGADVRLLNNEFAEVGS